MGTKLESRWIFLGLAIVLAGASLAEEIKPKVSVTNDENGKPTVKYEIGAKKPTSSTSSGTTPVSVDSVTVAGSIIVSRSNGLYKKPLKFKKLRIAREQTSFTTNTNEQGEYKFHDKLTEGAWTISIEGCPETKSVTVKGPETEIPEWTILCQKQ